MGDGVVRSPAAATTYTEWAVHPDLAGSVVCAWVDPARDARHVVLPDACMDLLWDGARLLIAGPDTGPATAGPYATVLGVRFRSGAAPGFLGVSAEELRDQRVPLEDCWGREATELAERVAGAGDGAVAVLEAALRRRLPQVAPRDPLIPWLLRTLVSPDRAVPALRDLARERGMDERTLRRRCVQGLGYGPKTLDRIVRFRRALRLGRSGLPLAAVAQAAGYADQAHLSRECRRLAGETPVALFAGDPVVISTTS